MPRSELPLLIDDAALGGVRLQERSRHVVGDGAHTLHDDDHEEEDQEEGEREEDKILIDTGEESLEQKLEKDREMPN